MRRRTLSLTPWLVVAMRFIALRPRASLQQQTRNPASVKDHVGDIVCTVTLFTWNAAMNQLRAVLTLTYSEGS